MDPSVEYLKNNWEHTHPLDRAQAIAAIRRRGKPIRELGRGIGRSDSTLRHLLDALDALAADIKPARDGAISINEFVRRAKKELERQEHRRGQCKVL